MSPTNSRIFELKFNFLTFAWANHRWEVPGSDANILNDFCGALKFSMTILK